MHMLDAHASVIDEIKHRRRPTLVISYAQTTIDSNYVLGLLILCEH